METLPDIRIRDAVPADATAIRDLLLEAYGQYETQFPEGRWAPYRDELIESVTREGPLARIVAESDGRIVGSILLFDSGDSAYGMPSLAIDTPVIRLLAVAREARGRGIAAALIEESARRSRELGALTMYLHTSDLMAAAIKLYERLGFERAVDKDMFNGVTHIKSYVLRLREAARR
ncbi:GNAT family N-acetyltransferase [Cohnella sp. REN36]|uniref:GNAT family N-acetyltransferase n=1 Tax=Cohnella sp. REN36 TaxID=2887347 RepID=UPI001D158C5E|nr:GNAT family N-acetyltransferase [Cohnella sp. REN36]MCC3371736.1 GNAT family N-acetyltransferase [Cohnella sp. REN36]